MLDVQRQSGSDRSTFSSNGGMVAESGLRHSTRNRAWGNPPWVRIPPLPPIVVKVGIRQTEKCYNFSLATSVRGAAYCVSNWAATLLLVVDGYSQLVSAAVHRYSHLIRNLNPPSPP